MNSDKLDDSPSAGLLQKSLPVTRNVMIDQQPDGSTAKGESLTPYRPLEVCSKNNEVEGDKTSLAPIDEPATEAHRQRPLTESEAAVVLRSAGMAMRLFPEFVADQDLHHRMVSLAEEAYKLADETYTMADAEAWAESFSIPRGSVDRDCSEYEACGRSLLTMASMRLDQVGPNRLSKHRNPLLEGGFLQTIQK